MILLKHTVRWDGFAGAPGYSNFYHLATDPQGDDAQDAQDDLYAFFLSLGGYYPNVARWTINPVWQAITDTAGTIVADGTVGTPEAVITGNSGAAFAGNSGYAIEWNTGVVVGGRRLKGRTYMVPAVGVFDADGTLSAAALSAIDSAAETFLGGPPEWRVWHRPTATEEGSSSPITSVTIRDRAAILRSRSV